MPITEYLRKEAEKAVTSMKQSGIDKVELPPKHAKLGMGYFVLTNPDPDEMMILETLLKTEEKTYYVYERLPADVTRRARDIRQKAGK